MRRHLILCVCALLWPTWVNAAISVVQVATASGNDATMTWSAAPSASNKVILLATIRDETATIDITGFHTDTETVLAGPLDAPTHNIRAYAWCATGDGSDTTLVVSTSNSSGASTIGIEISGSASCAAMLDDSETGEESTSTTHNLDAALTTTQSGDLIAALVVATGTADFTSDSGGGFTSVPASDVEINNIALGQYKVAGASGSEATQFTSGASRDTWMIAVAIKEAAAAATSRTLLLLGVGGC